MDTYVDFVQGDFQIVGEFPLGLRVGLGIDSKVCLEYIRLLFG